ncbi:unnamed protein product [Sphagnum troendelagicum]
MCKVRNSVRWRSLDSTQTTFCNRAQTRFDFESWNRLSPGVQNRQICSIWNPGIGRLRRVQNGQNRSISNSGIGFLSLVFQNGQIVSTQVRLGREERLGGVKPSSTDIAQ